MYLKNDLITGNKDAFVNVCGNKDIVIIYQNKKSKVKYVKK